MPVYECVRMDFFFHFVRFFSILYLFIQTFAACSRWSFPFASNFISLFRFSAFLVEQDVYAYVHDGVAIAVTHTLSTPAHES